MNARLPFLVSRLSIAWSAIYTTGMDPSLRSARRAEIASDNFEHLNDPELQATPYRLTWDVVQSLLRGIPSDVRWRASHMTFTGTFIQAVLTALPVAAFAGWIAFHATGSLSFGGIVLGGVEFVVAGLLLWITSNEELVMQSQNAAGSSSAFDTYLTSAALLLFPAIVLLAMLIIPMAGAGADPAGDEANLTERAASTGRWVAGYSLMALGWGIGILGVAGLGGIIRRAGASALGTLGPILFALGAIGVIAGGHGAVGIGLGATVEANGDGVAYLESSAQVGILYSWLGGIAAGIGLLLVGAGAWRARLLAGWQLRGFVGCMLIAGVVSGMLTGHGVNAVATVGPIVMLAGFGLLAWRLHSGETVSMTRHIHQPA